MAKKTTRRYRRKSGKWSPNIKTLLPVNTDGRMQFNANTFSAQHIVLCESPAQSNSTVSQAYTVKNVEFSFVVESTNSENPIPLENIVTYIMYIPQGYNLPALHTAGSFLDEVHPEWIMAYKYYGSPAPDFNQMYQPRTIKTRLSRKLQTGDAIILYVKAYNSTNSAQSMDLTGVIRWWTKAN